MRGDFVVLTVIHTPLRGVDAHEVGRGQRDAVHPASRNGATLSVAREMKHPAGGVAEIGEQERAVTPKRNAVGAQGAPVFRGSPTRRACAKPSGRMWATPPRQSAV